MLSRRLIRIKVLQEMYAMDIKGDEKVVSAAKRIDDALEDTWKAYICLLYFPVDFALYLDDVIDLENKKYFPDQKIVRQASVLRNSSFIAAISDGIDSQSKELSLIKWNANQHLLESLYNEVKNLDFWRDFAVFDKPTFEQTKEFVNELFFYFVDVSDNFNDFMDDMYASWGDDEAQLTKSVESIFSTMKEGVPIVPAKIQDIDMEMAANLFEKTVENTEFADELIIKSSEHWDRERIATVDLIILRMAIAEFLFFPQIPVKVTINEYLDLAKGYSTPNSSKFINGLLDKIRIQLTASGKLIKEGRGLREN